MEGMSDVSTSGETTPEQGGGSSGTQAVIAAATAIAGLVLCTHPASAIAQALVRTLPVIGAALPPLITACGTIVAAVSHPPKLRR